MNVSSETTKLGSFRCAADMEAVEQPISDEHSSAAKHVTKLPEVEAVAHAQWQHWTSAHAYYNYLMTSNARGMQFAAAAAQRRRLDSGLPPVLTLYAKQEAKLSLG